MFWPASNLFVWLLLFKKSELPARKLVSDSILHIAYKNGSSKGRLPSLCLGLKIRPRFENAKKHDSYGHENKISNTTIINKFNNKTEILNIFPCKKTTFIRNSLASIYKIDWGNFECCVTRDSDLYGTSLTKISHNEKSVNVTGLAQILVST